MNRLIKKSLAAIGWTFAVGLIAYDCTRKVEGKDIEYTPKTEIKYDFLNCYEVKKCEENYF